MAFDPTAPEPEPVGQKHVSGLLLASLFLSLGGFVLLPVIGPVVGVILAFLGKKKVHENPLLVGPRFALACVVIGIVSVGTQGFVLYSNLPGMMVQQALGEKVSKLLGALKERDCDGMYALMSADWQAEHTAESLKEMVDGAFPGEGPIELGEDGLRVREDEIDNNATNEKFKRFLDENPSEITFPVPYAVTPVGGREMAFDLDILTRRTGHITFEVELLDLKIYPLPEKPAEAENAPEEPVKAAEPKDPEDEPGENPR